MSLFGGKSKSNQAIPVHARIEPTITLDSKKAMAKRVTPFRHIRRFNAAQTSEIEANFTTTSSHINHDLRNQLRIIRARSRDLSKNNDYARKFLGMVENNVVGPDGVRLQAMLSGDDAFVESEPGDAIEEAFEEWCKPANCDSTGRRGFATLQHIFMRTLARDGEVLVQKIPRGPWNYQIRIIDVAQLDEQLWVDELKNGNRIRCGVELNKFDEHIAYHIRESTENEYGVSSYGATHQRLPATNTKLFFIDEDSEQCRGIPWMTSGTLRLHRISGFEHSALVAAKNGADKLGFFISPNGDPPPIYDDENADGQKIATDLPGHYDTLPQGWDYKAAESEYPHGEFGSFIKASLRGVAAGLNVSYHSLANDLEAVNFSSGRLGIWEEREAWKKLQCWMIEQFIDWVWDDWTLYALTLKKIPGFTLADRKTVMDCASWRPRRWAQIDPLKEVQANVLGIANGLKSRTQIILDAGDDPDDVWAQLQSESALLAGVVVDQAAAGTNTNQGNDTMPQDEANP